MHLGILIGWVLVLAAVLQPVVCAWLAVRKGRSVVLWTILGAIFGVPSGSFAAILIGMLAGMHARHHDHSWPLVVLLLPFLWPTLTTLLLPKIANGNSALHLKQQPKKAPRSNHP